MRNGQTHDGTITMRIVDRLIDAQFFAVSLFFTVSPSNTKIVADVLLLLLLPLQSTSIADAPAVAADRCTPAVADATDPEL